MLMEVPMSGTNPQTQYSEPPPPNKPQCHSSYYNTPYITRHGRNDFHAARFRREKAITAPL